MDFVIGGLAASGAGLFSNPFDVLKTRMQLQGELQAKGKHAVIYRNTIHAAYVVAKNEGIRGLQKGLGAALILHSVRNSVRLGLYSTLQKEGYLTDQKGKTIMHRSFVASALTGAAGAFIGSPMFLIKTQLQSRAAQHIAVGHQHHHEGVVGALRSIYNAHGIKGLWRGVNGTMLRALVGSSAQLTSFAVTKDMLKEYESLKDSPLMTSIAASFISTIFQTVAITPFDLVSTRLYNQGVDASGKGLLYNGIGDCFLKIWRAEGFQGFYKGIGPNYMRLAPHGALCLVFWDILKDLHLKYTTTKKINSF
ncbi:solute carrier family 25 member 35-like [Harmonia axyridis]|uniref:solute carrier family 25 member 35-like n=1 Tax=Harmonia axyridis TaxID=115357 RepID=UPI001E279994|nr:solute carrier family 25 member 35-like [Harmonia axyridis]XP_045474235.1 solute carrier family 25 member 35-like [Harmonia axyridis]